MSKVTQEWVEERRAALPGELLALVERQPGMPKTHYIYLKVAEGGLRGITEDKYAALERLLSEGRLEPGYSRGKYKTFSGLYPAGHPERSVPHVEVDLDEGLVELVRRDPGRGQSHYCRLPLAQGGLRGSQERKERAMARLLEQGRLRLFELPFKAGRLTHAVYPAASGLASKEE